MNIQIGREQFLRCLESVKSGLSPREMIEQSSCFVFVGGDIITYNDESSVRGPSGLPKEFSGAVASVDLLELVRKLDEDNIKITDDGGKFWVKGHRRRAWHNMEADIRLPYESVEVPDDKWISLPEDFTEAVNLVKDCVGKESTKFELTCVNLAPDWLEACDDFQACRWRMKTGFTNPLLVKRSAIEAVSQLGVHEFCEGTNWVHFRNGRGFVLSCRRYCEEYPSGPIESLMSEKGTTFALPKGLPEVVEKANIYSQHNPDTNMVEITLSSNRLTLVGRGASGGYQETRQATWSGPEVTFLISPTLLTELVKKYNEVSIGTDVLRIDGGAYTYATSLAIPTSNGKKGNGNGEEESE